MTPPQRLVSWREPVGTWPSQVASCWLCSRSSWEEFGTTGVTNTDTGKRLWIYFQQAIRWAQGWRTRLFTTCCGGLRRPSSRLGREENRFHARMPLNRAWFRSPLCGGFGALARSNERVTGTSEVTDVHGILQLFRSERHSGPGLFRKFRVSFC